MKKQFVVCASACVVVMAVVWTVAGILSTDNRVQADEPSEGDARREGDRPVRRDGDRERENRLRPGDRIIRIGREEAKAEPETDREQALYQIILELKREVQLLRAEMNELRRQRGPQPARRDEPARRDANPFGAPRDPFGPVRRDGDAPREREAPRDGDAPAREGPRDGDRPAREGRRDGDVPRRAPAEGDARAPNRRPSRIDKVFVAYDKDGNQHVSFQEWCAMKEGAFDAEREARERGLFDQVDADGNGVLSSQEFANWRTRGLNVREGGRRGPRDGEAPANRGPREGGPRGGDPPPRNVPKDGASGPIELKPKGST